MTFRTKLVVSLIILLLPMAVEHFYDRYHQYVNTRETALTQQMQNASALAQAMQVFVERTITYERAIGLAIIEPRWHGTTGQDSYLQSILRESRFLKSIGFTEPSGKIVFGAPLSIVGTDIHDRGYFRSILSGKPWATSDVLVTRTKHQPGFIIATGVRDASGQLAGVVVASVDEVQMLTALHPLRGSHTLFVLLDRSGRVAMEGGEPKLTIKQRDWRSYLFVREALQGKSVTVRRLRVASELELTGAMVHVGDIGWAAGTFVPTSEITGPAVARTLRDLIVTVIVLALTLLIASIIARQFIGPVQELADTAEELGKGNLSARAKPPGTIELASLAGTMNTMAGAIQQRDEELRQAYERERRIASTMQSSMLPKVQPNVGRLELATAYYPALEEAELGGDFYDVMYLRDGLVGLTIADVSGKGLSAAVHTAMAKYMLEGFASQDSSPASVLRKLNAALSLFLEDQAGETFVTLFFAVIDSSAGEMVYANAGHPAPLLRRADGSVLPLGTQPGFPLGVSELVEYNEIHVQMAEGDMLLMYTDGIIEAHKNGIWFGSEDLQKLLQESAPPPDQLVHHIYSTVAGTVGGRVPDDVALIGVRLNAD